MRSSVTDQGVLLRDGRLIPWADVYHVDWEEDWAVIATAVGTVHVERADGLRAEAKIAPWEAERDAAMDAADPLTIAQWTGAPPDRIYVQPLSRLSQLKALLLVLAMLGIVAAIWAAPNGDTPWVLLDVFGPLTIWWLSIAWWRLTHPRLIRTPAGVRVGGQRFRWRDLQRAVLYHHMRNEGPRTVFILQTRRGRFELLPIYRDWQKLCDELEAAAVYRTRAAAADHSRGIYAPSTYSPGVGLWLDSDGLKDVLHGLVRRYPLSAVSTPDWNRPRPGIDTDGKYLGAEQYLDIVPLAQQLEERLGTEQTTADPPGEEDHE